MCKPRHKFHNKIKNKNKCLIGKRAHSFAKGVSVRALQSFCTLKCILTRSARAKILLYHFLKPWPRGESSHCAKTSIQAELLPAQRILNSHISPGISLQPPNVIPFRDIMIFQHCMEQYVTYRSDLILERSPVHFRQQSNGADIPPLSSALTAMSNDTLASKKKIKNAHLQSQPGIDGFIHYFHILVPFWSCIWQEHVPRAR